jgi:hypothetical protein
MTMRPRVRKLALTAHVTSSVGWLGAVVAYLALAVTGLIDQNAEAASGAYIAMWVVASSVIVPFSLAALLTGLVQSLGTEWGVFRHYWITSKFVLTVAAAIVLLLHMGTVSRMADITAGTKFAGGDTGDLRRQLVVHAAGGLLVLLTATVLSFLKPWGRTPYGNRSDAPSGKHTPWRTIVVVGAVALLLLAVVLHVLGGGPRVH